MGIQNLTQQPIQIYPNPASDKVNVVLTQSNAKELTLYNALGQQIHSNPINKNQQHVVLNVADFAPGIYVVKIKFDDNTISQCRLTVF